MKSSTPPIKVNHFALSILVIGAVFGLGVFFLLATPIKTIGSSLEELSQRSQLVESPSNPAEVLEKQTLSDQVFGLLPTTGNAYDLATEIEVVAQSSGVTITGLSLNDPSDSLANSTTSAAAKQGATPSVPGASESTISMSVAGEYQALQDFIDGMTTLSRFVQIDSLSIAYGQTPGEESSGTALVATISARAFHVPL